MRFGLIYDLRNPEKWLQPFDQLYNQFLDQSQAIDELGFDTLWVAEHHYSDEGWIPAALPLCAAVAARTRRIKIGPGIIPLPLYNPVRVAEDITVLDYVSRGRARLGVGLGYRAQEFDTDLINRSERIARLTEGIHIITRCWTEDEFTHEGRYYTFKGMRFYPKPIQKPHPPIYIAAQAEPAVRRAARLGCHVFPTGSRRLSQSYVDALVENDRDPGQFEVVALADQIFTSHDPEGDWQKWRDHVMHRWIWYYKAYSESTTIPVMSLEERERRSRKSFLTVPETIEYVRTYIERVQCTEIAVFAGFPGMPLEASYAPLELFAKEVMPHFRDGEVSAI